MLVLVLLCLGALACGPDERAIEAARARFDAALAERDVAAALGAVDSLEAALPATPESALELAHRLGRAGEMTRALWLLEAAVDRHPESREIRLGLAETALVVGDPDRAMAVLADVPPGSGDDTRPVRLRARAQLALGNLEGAIATFAEAEAERPGIELTALRIDLLVREKQFDRALSLVREVAAREGLADDERSWLKRSEADLLAVQGDPQAALDLLEALTVGHRGEPDAAAWRSRTALMVGQGRSREAIADLEALIRVHGDVSGLQALLANAHVAAGDREAAEAVLRARSERDPSVANTIDLADFLHRSERPLEAVGLIDRQLALDTVEHGIELEYLRIALLLAAGDDEAARAGFAAFGARHPDDPRTGYLQARMDLVDGRPQLAAMRLKQILPRHDRADVHHWLAVALEQSGDAAGAEQRYGIAIFADPSQVASYHGLLRTLAARGAWAQVEQWARRLLLIAPDGTAGYEALVRARIRQGDGEGAVAATRVYGARHPDVLAPRIAQSMALRRQDRPDAALAVLDETRARFGADPEWIAELGVVLGRLGRASEGLDAVDAALTRHPSSRALRRARGFLLFTAGRGEEAMREVERWLALAPDDPQPLRMAGDHASQRADFEAARGFYLRHLAIEPLDPEVLFRLGLALEALGQDDQAIDAYRRAAQAAPGSAAARNNLALVLDRRQRLDEALIAAQSAYARAESDPAVLDTLAGLYLKAGRGQRAVALFERAVRLAPADAEIRRRLAAAYLETGHEHETRALQDDRAGEAGAAGDASDPMIRRASNGAPSR